MKGISELKARLQVFYSNRKIAILPSADEREEYAKVIGDCFMPCAQSILAGFFTVTNQEGGGMVIREIHPTAIELYYHEEGDERFKDPIMYHTDDRKKAEHPDFFQKRGINSIPYFPVGSIHPHTSGIDITFENPELMYRASFLIREYNVVYVKGEPPVKVKNSTEIYDDMLIQGIPLENSDWMEWHDGGMIDEKNIERCGRRNVAEFVKNKSGEWRKNTDIVGRDHFTLGGVQYVKCPFKWQFRIRQ